MNTNIVGPKRPMPADPIKIVKIIRKVVGAGKKLLEKIFSGEDVKNKKPMDEKQSSTDDIMQLNLLLVEYRDKVAKESKEVEEEIQNICKNIFEQIIESVEFANTEFKFYRIETLQRKLNRYIEEIDGLFAKHVSYRISLDDPECINILKMMPGELKAERMSELKKKVFMETIDELCKIIEEFEVDFLDGMEMTVEDKMISLENLLSERKEIFEKMSADTENAEKEKCLANTKARFQTSKADLAYMLMEGAI